MAIEMYTITEYDIIKDIILISLAVAGLVGAVAYKIITGTLERRLLSRVHELQYRTMATTKTHVGHTYWKNFKKFADITDLDLAIDLSEEAYKDYASHLNEKEPDNEKLICWIKNNLAYYYAERGKLEDGAKARRYAEYIFERSDKFESSFEADLNSTYKYVQRRFPKSRIDIYLKKQNK